MSAESDKRRRRHLDEGERALWERATHSIVPLRGRAAKPAMPGAALKRPTVARADPLQARQLEKPLPEVEPLQRRHKQRLARGSASIDARIDLHGKTQSEAQAALSVFLRRAQREGARFVLVITGKGLRASGSASEGGVLKRQVPLWLHMPQFRPYVVSFEQAHISHGGEGALYVQVRRGRAA